MLHKNPLIYGDFSTISVSNIKDTDKNLVQLLLTELYDPSDPKVSIKKYLTNKLNHQGHDPHLFQLDLIIDRALFTIKRSLLNYNISNNKAEYSQLIGRTTDQVLKSMVNRIDIDFAGKDCSKYFNFFQYCVVDRLGVEKLSHARNIKINADTYKKNVQLSLDSPVKGKAHNLIKWAFGVLDNLENLEADQWPQAFCALLVATGRNQKEILKCASFWGIDSNDIYKSYIVGFNNGKLNNYTEFGPIYCLVPSNMVLAGVEWVRNILNLQIADTKSTSKFYLDISKKIKDFSQQVLADYFVVMDGDWCYTNSKGKVIDRRSKRVFYDIYQEISYKVFADYSDRADQFLTESYSNDRPIRNNIKFSFLVIFDSSQKLRQVILGS